MRGLMRCAAWLYPKSWRARYGGELDALMEDVNPRWADFFDICKGAMRMQILRGSPMRFTAACALMGVLIAATLVWRTPAQYRSQAVLRMPPGIEFEQLNQAEQSVLSRKSLARVVQQYNLYPEERTRDPLEQVVLDMRNRSIQIRMLQTAGAPQDTKAFLVAFDYRDPKSAQAVTNDLIAQFTGAMHLEVLDPASLPQRSYRPNGAAWLLAGLLLGCVTAVVLMGIRRWPLVPLTGVGLMLLVWPATYLIPNQYRSNAVVRARSAPQVLSDDDYMRSLILSNNLYAKERASMPSGEVTQLMRRHLLVKPIESPVTQAVLIEFDYPDRYKAQEVVREIVSKMDGTVLDPASLPEKAYTPNRLVMLAAALCAGLAIGVVMAAIRRQRSPAIAG